jgi:type I restriction enzyme S subunit
MSEWKECKLGEVAEVVGGGTPKTDVAEYWNGEIPWLSVADFNNGRKYVYDTEKKISEKGLQNSSTKILKKGNIIISARGTVGVIAVLGKQMAFNQSCYGIRALEHITMNDYVYYLLKDTVSNFLQIAHGGVFDTITKDTFNEIDIILPPLSEQRAIASVLSSLDDKIDLLHRENKTLEAMAEALFRQWFIEEADDGWEEGTISDLIDILSGFPFKSDTFIESGKYHLITIKAVQDGYLELSNADKINDIPSKMPEYCHLKQGDILLSLTGNVGRCCLVNIDYLVLNQRVAKLRPKNTRDIAYTYIFFRMENTRRLLEEMAKGTAQPNLSPVETAQMQILIPSTDKLEFFADISNPLIQKVLNNKIQIRTLEKMRDTLLPKLMSGEVRVAI